MLQGIRNDKEHEATKAVLSELVFPPMAPETFYTAAHIYRTCRSKGLTIRNSTDWMIAATWLQHEASLLHNDKDFDLIGSRFDLQIVQKPE